MALQPLALNSLVPPAQSVSGERALTSGSVAKLKSSSSSNGHRAAAGEEGVQSQLPGQTDSPRTATGISARRSSKAEYCVRQMAHASSQLQSAEAAEAAQDVFEQNAKDIEASAVVIFVSSHQSLRDADCADEVRNYLSVLRGTTPLAMQIHHAYESDKLIVSTTLLRRVLTAG